MSTAVMTEPAPPPPPAVPIAAAASIAVVSMMAVIIAMSCGLWFAYFNIVRRRRRAMRYLGSNGIVASVDTASELQPTSTVTSNKVPAPKVVVEGIPSSKTHQTVVVDAILPDVATTDDNDLR